MNLLSIDLDYWNGSEIDWAWFTPFLKRATVYEHHHAILPDINKFSFEHVVNMDYHSDIGDPTENMIAFNCGTWVNFLKYRKNYTWVSPSRDRWDGWCHVDKNPFKEKVTDFKKLKICTQVPPLKYDHVVVITSPDFTSEKIMEDFLKNYSGTINKKCPRDIPLKRIPSNGFNL